MNAIVRMMAVLLCCGSVAGGGEPDEQRSGSGVDIYGDPLPVGVSARLGTIRYRHPGWYKHVEFLPDQPNFVVSTKDNSPRVLSAESGQSLREFKRSGQLLDFRILADGSAGMLTTVINGETRICQSAFMLKHDAGGKLHRWEEPFTLHSVRFAISLDHSTLITGTYNGNVKLINLESGEVVQTRELFRGNVESMRLSPDGKLLVVAGRRDVFAWAWQSERPPVQLKGLPRGGQALCFSNDGSLLAVGSSYRCAASLFDTATLRKLRDLNPDSDSYYREDVCFSPDDRFLFVPDSRGCAIQQFEVSSAELTRTFPTDGIKARTVDISDDGRFLVTTGSQAAVMVWDLNSGERISDRFLSHTGHVEHVCFLREHGTVCTSGVDGIIHAWNTGSGTPLWTARHERWVVGMAQSTDGALIASCGLDNTVRVWDAVSGQQKLSLSGHGMTGGSSSAAIAFDARNEHVLSFGIDFFLQKHDLKTGRTVDRLSIRPAGVEFEEDENGVPEFDAEQRFFSLSGAIFDDARTTLFIGLQKAVVGFSVVDGKESFRFVSDHTVDRFAVSPDGRSMAVVSRMPEDEQGTRRFELQLVDVASEQVQKKTLIHDFSYRLNYVDDELIAVAVNEQAGSRSSAAILFLELEGLTQVAELPVGNEQIRHLAFDLRERMAVCRADGVVHLHRINAEFNSATER